jgi:hypothetical protein
VTHRPSDQLLDEPVTGEADDTCCRSTPRSDGCPCTGGTPTAREAERRPQARRALGSVDRRGVGGQTGQGEGHQSVHGRL